VNVKNVKRMKDEFKKKNESKLRIYCIKKKERFLMIIDEKSKNRN
jgi:hypothetical protein